MSRKYIYRVGALVALIATLWYGGKLYEHSVIFHELSVSSVYFFVLCVLLYFIAAILIGIAWHSLLIDAGVRVSSYSAAISITCLSQIGKYVPGNVAQHVGRVALAKRHGFPLKITIFTMFMETLWVIAMASLLSLLAVLFVGRQLFVDIPQMPQWWILAGMGAGAMLVPMIGHRLFEWATRWWAQRNGLEFRSIRMPSLRTFWLVGMLYVGNFLILGLVLQIIAASIFGAPGAGFLVLSGIFAAAWIAGFITPGAPAGLGVREVVLMAALTPIYGNETAIGIAAVLRVVTVVGDVLAFLIGLALTKSDTSQITIE